MPSPTPDPIALRIIGKLLESPQHFVLVVLALGALGSLAVAILFAFAQWGVPALRAWRGKNGNGHAVEQRDPGGLRYFDAESEVSGREFGRVEEKVGTLEGRVDVLTEKVDRLTIQMATVPHDTAEYCIAKLLERGIVGNGGGEK